MHEPRPAARLSLRSIDFQPRGWKHNLSLLEIVRFCFSIIKKEKGVLNSFINKGLFKNFIVF